MHFCSKCDSEFSNNTEFEVHNSQEYCTTITALDENCIDKILEFLSPNDLAAMSLTCKRYKELAERYFYLNWNTEPIYIGAFKETVQFYFKSSKEFAYEKCFNSLIRSVSVFNDESIKIDSFQFIRQNCAKHLQSLELISRYFGASDFYQMNGKIIENQLKHLKHLKLKNILLSDIYDVLLKYCEQLQTLTIFFHFFPFDDADADDLNYGSAWINQTYPHLESLTLCISDEFNINLFNFLELNTNLKKIICSNRSAIKSICQAQTKFDYAALLFYPEDDAQNFLQVQNDIIDWCERDCCKQLELSIRFFGLTEQILRKVLNLQNVIALHFNPAYEWIFPKNISAPNLTKLCISFKGIDLTDEILDELDKCFPNLNELILVIKLNIHTGDNKFRKHFSSIVSRFTNLKTYKLMTATELKCLKDDIIEVNRVRLNLEKASNLIIFLGLRNFNELRLIPEEQSIVQIKLDDPDFCTICNYSYHEDVSQRLKVQSEFYKGSDTLRNMICRDRLR